MKLTAEIADPRRYVLGESPVWCEQRQRLYFVDIQQQLLLIFDPATSTTQAQTLPDLTSAVALTTDPDMLLLVSDRGLFMYCLSQQRIEQKLADYPENRAFSRSNEGAISPQGDLFFGTMVYDAEQAEGHWYRFCAHQREIQRIGQPVSVGNTLCWYNDTLYFADSETATLYLTHDTMLTQQYFDKAERGAPDGSTICAEGKLWNARYKAAELAVYNLNAITPQAHFVPLPALKPTSCCFGGHDLSTLFITTASEDIDQPNHWQGRLLQIKHAGKGRLTPRFNLAKK